MNFDESITDLHVSEEEMKNTSEVGLFPKEKTNAEGASKDGGDADIRNKNFRDEEATKAKKDANTKESVKEKESKARKSFIDKIHGLLW